MNRGDLQCAVHQDLRYRLLKPGTVAETGTGRSVNISRGEVCFEAERQLPAGAPIEVAINWPSLLDGNCPMKLIVHGRVTRAKDRQTECTILRYEFRSRPRTRPVAGTIHLDAPVGPSLRVA